MANYTYAQLQGFWVQNGGNPATAALAAAVAEAESGGNAQVTSPNPGAAGCTNVGLWQLATPCGGGAGLSVQQLQDPNVNAAAAVAASSGGQNWSTWETYANGAYKRFLSNGTTPDTTGLPASPITDFSGLPVSGAAPGTPSAPPGSTCIIAYPSWNVNVLVTHINLGGGCILTKSEGRAIIGAALLGVAGIIGIAAAVILAASAFEHSGASSAVTKAAAAVTPAGRVVSTAEKVAPRPRARATA